MYRKGIVELAAMSDLPKEFRVALLERATICVPRLERVTPSQDGSEKLVLRLGDDALVSAVLMPDEDRLTLCLSTQVGCGFGCAFCLTGTMGVERNLTPGEILGQLLVANGLARRAARVTHMVFMGMGEPLANLTAPSSRRSASSPTLGSASAILRDASPSRLSGWWRGSTSSGAKPWGSTWPFRCTRRATTSASRLMPVNRSWNLEALMAAVRRYPLAPTAAGFLRVCPPRRHQRRTAGRERAGPAPARYSRPR